MIGKPITGRSFGGCVRYLMNRQEATILEAEGVRIQSARSTTMDFNQQRKLNPGLSKAVGHTILSWSVEDKERLTDGIMASVAKEYMEKMGITDTQYLIVRHTDREHPHLHIVYNRVNNEGETISDQNNYKRNVKACRELTQRYGYYLAPGKGKVNRQQLKGSDQLRYQIHDAVKDALKDACDWQGLEASLQEKGIGIHRKYKGDSGEVQGISFSKEGITFKGSAIDRSMSYANLDRQLQQQNSLQKTVNPAYQPSGLNVGEDNQSGAYSKENRSVQYSGTTEKTDESILDILFEHYEEGYQYDPTAEAYKRRKKKNEYKQKH
jgi:hypothetical protein